jgi:hypothetical protein
MGRKSRNKYTEPADVRPAFKWYGVPIFMLIVGIGMATSFSYKRFHSYLAALPQIKIPGNAQMALKKGKYLIYHDYATTYDGKEYVVKPGLDQYSLILSPSETGTQVPLTAVDATNEEEWLLYTYGFLGRAGVAAYSFTIEETGSFTLAAAAAPDKVNIPATVILLSSTAPMATLYMHAADGFLMVVFVLFFALTTYLAIFVVRQREMKRLGLK